MKVLVIGLDSVPPGLLFGRFLKDMPNLKALYDEGLHGDLETCHPPITIPAWTVMMSSKSPGKLGIYGFRHRRGWSYHDGYIVSSANVKEPCVWDIIAKQGLRSTVIGLPPAYPPKPMNGNLITCLITPGPEKQYTWPAELKGEVEKLVGEYVFDVTFRLEDRDGVKKELFEMTKKRFEVAKYLARKQDWNLFILHEIGFDRLHHAFWKYFDPAHPKYEAGNRYENVAREYYKMVDAGIGELLHSAGEDVAVFVLSDHGSKAMKGAFCINQWLIEQGYLKLKSDPSGVVDIEKADVDWPNTKAWGWGGYYARIFFNVKGRELNGCVAPAELTRVKSEIKKKIGSIKDPTGRRMKNRVFEPDEVYRQSTGDKPDLMVYFDDLDWRSAGTIGHPSLYLSENDTGPDDSVHSMNGVFVYTPPRGGKPRELHGLNIIDIAPTILRLMEVPVPPDMEGKPVELGAK